MIVGLLLPLVLVGAVVGVVLLFLTIMLSFTGYLLPWDQISYWAITIGGNDIGFSSIAEDCFTFQRTGSPCRDQYVQNGRDEISERIQATAPLVAAVFQGIHERSPEARVFVLTYAAIFPEQDTAGCWPQMPVADGDIDYLREKWLERDEPPQVRHRSAGSAVRLSS